MKNIRRFASEETGQALTEYALILGFILFATIAVVAGYSKSIAGVTNSVNSNLLTAANMTQVVEPGPANQIVSQSAQVQVR